MGAFKRSMYLIAVTAFLLSLSCNLNAASPDYGFFKGKIITYIVATQPGGGYDTYGRLIGKYMQKHIPGSTVIIKNIPGAGHIIGANEIYLSKPDGLTLGTFNPGLIYSQIVGLPGIRFDLKKFDWIGKASTDARIIIVSNKSSLRTMKDILDAKEIKMATSGVGASDHNDTIIVGYALGANFRAVPGYGGRGGEMAMLRGEVDGQLGTYSSLAPFIKAEKCPVVLQIAAKKHRELPDVPLASEFKVPPEKAALIRLVAGVNELGRLTAATPNLPPARLQVLRDAYRKALTDPDLLREAGKMGLDLDPGFGADVEKTVAEALSQPEENVSVLKKLLQIK